MTFEPSATKAVPILPEVEGDPAEGFEIVTRSAEPAIVDVIGPQSAVATVMAAITEPVSVAGASATIVKTVSVGVADPSVRLKSIDLVRVTVTIRPARARR